MVSKKVSYDGIVVGAGVAGLGAAIGLAKAGQKVLLISKKQKGESSPAAAGILDPVLEMKPRSPLFLLCREAFNRYPALIRDVEKKTGRKAPYQMTGMLYLALNAAEERVLKGRYQWQKKSGIAAVWLDRDAVVKKFPGVTAKVRSGLFYPTIGRVVSPQWVELLTQYARSLGVRILEAKEEPEVLIKQGRVQGVKSGRTIFQTHLVVSATGSWFGKVVPARGQIIILKKESQRGRPSISTILHSVDGGYLVPWNKQEYLIGSTVEFAGFKPTVTPQGQRQILEKVKRIAPSIAGCKQIDSWAGLRPFSKDRLPLIGPTRIQGLYIAAGYFRSGILIGCHAGELLAKGILSGRMPPSLKPFAPDRVA